MSFKFKQPFCRPRNQTFTLQAACCSAPWVWSAPRPRCPPPAGAGPGAPRARLPARTPRASLHGAHAAPARRRSPCSPRGSNGSGCGSRGPSPPSRSPARRERRGRAAALRQRPPLAQQGREHGSQQLGEDRMIFLVAGGSCTPAAAPCGTAARALWCSVSLEGCCGAWPPAGVRHPGAARGSCSTRALPQSPSSARQPTGKRSSTKSKAGSIPRG